MARIRTIKPSFFKNESLAELPAVSRLLFIGLWCLADKEGRMEDRPKRIKAELFPYDNIDIDSTLSRLQSAGFVIRYEVGDLKVIQVINFSKHQRITGTESQSDSEWPPPEGNTLETLRKHSGSQEGKGMEGNKEGKGTRESVCYDIEKELLNNRIQFEKICMAASVEEKEALSELHKFHLWMQKNEKYPTGVIAAYAGFESWLINRGRFKKETNGKSISQQKSDAAANYLATAKNKLAGALRAEDP